MITTTSPKIEKLIDMTALDEEALSDILFQRTLFVHDTTNIHESAIIGDRAILTGDVKVGPDTVIFYNTMIQADKASISIGEGCCIVDGVSMHNKVEVGDFVHIAHGCMIHRKGTSGTLKIGPGSLIGFSSQVHESVGRGCQIAPGVIVDRPIPDYHFVYEKKQDDGSKLTVVSPMRAQNYEKVVQMYENFWGRKIIIKGQLISLDWDKNNIGKNRRSFGEAVLHLKSFFNPNL